MEFILSILARLISSPLLLIFSIFGGLFLYLLTLTIYRLYFHPLSAHPGPALAKLSNLYLAYHAYKGTRHLAVYSWHLRYGPIIRVGPNTLSINSASALKTIYGFKSNVQKSDFYKAFPVNPRAVNVHSSIDKRVHARKRRVLAHAFSDSAMKTLERYVLDNIRTGLRLLAQGENNGKNDAVLDMSGNGSGKMQEKEKDTTWGKEWNVGNWSNWLVFDIMGDLVFGKGFGMLEEEKNRFACELVGNAAHRHLICGTHLPLHTYHLDTLLFPHIASQRSRYMNYSKTQALARTKLGTDTDRKDFFHHLLQARDPETGSGFTIDELWGESNVLIIAGSDTTATALAATLFYLSRNPESLKKLQEEIRNAFQNEEDIISGATLNKCSYLRACIDEGMRLSPPVPGFLPREVLPGGLTIDGTFLPPGTVVGVTTYAIHRHPTYFPSPHTFIPDRWLSDAAQNPYHDNLDAAHAAFCPFSIGPRGCIGRGLAYMELGIAVARVVWGFDFVRVAGVRGEMGAGRGRGEWGRECEKEFQIWDRFASYKEGPVLRFRRREGL